MRWYVEIAPVGKASLVAKLCLEASHWQPALQQARRLRDEDDKLGGLSVEFLEDGCRAIDSKLRLTYRVSRAPDDAALDDGKGASDEKAPEKAPAPEEGAARGSRSSRPEGRRRRSKKRIPKKGSKTIALGSTGAAELREEAAKIARAEAEAEAAAETAAAEPPPAEPAKLEKPTKARTMIGLAPDVEEAVEKAKEAARAQEKPAPAPKRPAPPAAYDVTQRREIAASPDRPVHYREASLAVELPMKLTTLRAVAKHALGEEQEALAGSEGRLVKLAIFDHAFDERPEHPPVLTLEWADWRDEAAIVFFPYAEKPAGSLEQARVSIGGGDMLTRDNLPGFVTAAELARREEEARKKREEEQARAAEALAKQREEEARKEAEARKKREAEDARKKREEEDARKKREEEEARKKREEEDARKKREEEEARKKREEEDARKKREEDERVRLEQEAQRALEAKKREEEEARREEASTREAEAKRARKEAAKTATDGTPRRSSSGRSRRSIADRKRKSAAPRERESGSGGPTSEAPPTPRKGSDANRNSQATARSSNAGSRPSEARAAGTPIARVALKRPAVGFDEPISRAHRDQRNAAARERAESIAPPPSRRGQRVAGDQLIADMFEAVAELFFLNDALEGADFVLRLAMEKLPCEAGIVSLFDIDRQEFVVVRQTGGDRSALLLRIPEHSPLQRRAMRGHGAVIASDAEGDDTRWEQMGVEVRSLVVAPVAKGGRYLGLIELANPFDGKAFSEGDGNAVTYIGEQFAEFLDQRGVLLDPDAVVATAEANSR